MSSVQLQMEGKQGEIRAGDQPFFYLPTSDVKQKQGKNHLFIQL